MRERPAVLHILSDWKWTGPAEPTVNLCRALQRRGFPVHFVCKAAQNDRNRSVEQMARERAVEPILGLRLDKRPNILSNRRDIRALAEIIEQNEAAIVHTHTTHDHYLGVRAAKRASTRPSVVRTNHTGEPLRMGPLFRFLLRGRTHGCVGYSQACVEADCRALRVPSEFGLAVEGAIDLERFGPSVSGAAMREAFGFGPSDAVFGVVARIQPHRRFDIIMEGFRRAVAKEPSVRGLILGRGTRQAKLVDAPIERMGLRGKVAHPGYRVDDYPESVAAMDAMVFLVPGTDGSCRAAREAMALGKPIIVSRRGILPELVRDGVHGLVIEESAEALAEAIGRLARRPELRARMGAAAQSKARDCFRLDQQADAVEELYMEMTKPAVERMAESRGRR